MDIQFHRFLSPCCIDIDECEAGTDMCEQNCQDTLGSYACGCDPGYILNADGRTCTGMSSHVATYMWHVVTCMWLVVTCSHMHVACSHMHVACSYIHACGM